MMQLEKAKKAKNASLQPFCAATYHDYHEQHEGSCRTLMSTTCGPMRTSNASNVAC